MTEQEIMDYFKPAVDPSTGGLLPTIDLPESMVINDWLSITNVSLNVSTNLLRMTEGAPRIRNASRLWLTALIGRLAQNM